MMLSNWSRALMRNVVNRFGSTDSGTLTACVRATARSPATIVVVKGEFEIRMYLLQGSGFRIQGLECSVSGLVFRGLGVGVQGSGFRVQGVGFRVWSSGFRVQGLGLRGVGFRV